MSNDTQVLDRNPIASSVAGNQVQPQIGSLNKEVPLAAGLSELKPAGPETQHGIDKELTELGVKETINRPNLTLEHQELGVDHAGPHVPVSLSPSGKVSLPMSEEEVAEKLKTGQDDDSGKWLAGLIQKIIRVIGL